MAGRSWVVRLLDGIRRPSRRRRIVRGMEEEFRFHLDMEARDRAERGEPPGEARRRARIDFGGEDRYRAEARDALGLRWFDDARADARFAVRGLLRRPLFTVVVVGVLGVGIGVNAAVFAVLDRVYLRPLPYADGSALMMLWQGTPDGRSWVSGPDFADWSAETRVFAGMAAFTPERFNLAAANGAETVTGAEASASLFTVLGVAPALGRAFGAADAEAGAPGVIVLSDALWRRQFGADPAVVGRPVDVEGEPATVLGVMPAGFAFPSGAEAWVPLKLGSQDWRLRRGIDWLQVVARVAPGGSDERLSADLERVASRLAERYPETNAGDRIDAVPLREQLYGDLRAPILLLMGAVGSVLLMMCASVAAMMLARATGRRTEMAVRLALGSGRVRLARALLTESMVLAVAGGLAGLLLSRWAGRALLALAPLPAGLPIGVSVDARVLGFAVLATLATGVLFGIAPAVLSSREPLETALRASRGSGGPRIQLLRRGLVVGQIAIAVVLASGGLLLGRSLLALRGDATGFSGERVLTGRIALTEAYYPDDADQITFFERLVGDLAAAPGVDAVAMASDVPLTGSGITFSFSVVPGVEEGTADDPLAGFRIVGPGYFDAMSIPVVSGRDFGTHDHGQAGLVVAIDETLARQHFRDRSPIGQRLRVAREWREIVAVVGEIRQGALDAAPAPTIYVPYAQRPVTSAYIVVRGVDRTPPAGVIADAVRQIDRTQPVHLIQPMNEIVTAATGQWRFLAFVVGAFAATALLIAALGVYGIVAFAVTGRSREFGVRLALGARPAAVTRVALRDGLILLAMGLPIGTGAAIALAGVLEDLLYEVPATDPATLITAPALLALTTIVAAWLPARRAARVEPMRVLGAE